MKTFTTAFVLAAMSWTANAAPCDRACLDKLVDTYISALVTHNPSGVPFAAQVKFVENTLPMKPGEGLWKTASAGPTTFKIYVPDPVAQQVGFMCVMQEDGKPIQFALRLKLKNGKITEAEHLIARGLQPNSLKNLETPRPGLLAAVPPAERTPRDKMLKIAYSYYTALVTGNGDAAPFADDCVRHENGMQTTGNPPPKTPGFGTVGAMGCHDQLNTHIFDYITRIEPRRVEIADVEDGLVFGLSQFRQPMKQNFVKIVGVPGVEKVDMPFKAFDLPAAHIFKIRAGKIHEIEAMGFMLPYNSKTGWEKTGK
ncbi:MAG TPA: hypothetical protein VMU80_23900 [Bryobacteraceae bacterium]|nr:hypothetical protein [Bryobacteraceae bacterium]HUO32280.1 hypothetical protein [Bryobacteraceae bacterium]